MKVTIYSLEGGKNSVEGSFSLTGQGVVANPADSELLREMMSEPIYDVRAGKMVSARSDPEAWLAGLSRHYRSPYLRASEPQ